MAEADRVLYGYYRSSAAWRVRIALALKGLAYRQLPVSLVKGEQRAGGYLALNPQGLVPALQDKGRVLTQSLAICEYLDEAYPGGAPLLPPDPADRARARAMALLIAADVHPLNNLRVLQFLTAELGVGEEGKQAWYAHWLREGFAALERMLAEGAGRCCLGDEVTLADICLVPQVYNARRFKVPLEDFPLVTRVSAWLESLPAFADTHPDRQPDAPPAG